MSTSYSSYWSPQQESLWNTVLPYVRSIYNPAYLAKTGDDLWNVPNLQSWMPNVNNYMMDSSAYALPNASDYTAGGDVWQGAYEQMAPAYMNTMTDVLNQTKDKYANSGTLGSAYGGTSGAAADALLGKENEMISTLNKDVTTNVQDLLTKAYGAEASSADTRYGYGQNLLSNAYSTDANAMTKYYEEYLKEQQYPYEQVASLLTSAYPTNTATTESSGSSK